MKLTQHDAAQSHRQNMPVLRRRRAMLAWSALAGILTVTGGLIAGGWMMNSASASATSIPSPDSSGVKFDGKTYTNHRPTEASAPFAEAF